MKTIKKILLSVVALSLLVTLAACSSSTAAEGKVVIYTNGDEAASEAMESALNRAGLRRGISAPIIRYF